MTGHGGRGPLRDRLREVGWRAVELAEIEAELAETEARMLAARAALHAAERAAGDEYARGRRETQWERVMGNE